MNQRRVRTVQAALIVIKVESHGQQYILQQWDADAKKFQLIGGAIEPNESPLNAAEREVQEELGITSSSMRLTLLNAEPIKATTISPTYGVETDYALWIFSAELLDGVIRLTDSERWVALDRLLGSSEGVDAPLDVMYRALDEAVPGGLAGISSTARWSQIEGERPAEPATGHEMINSYLKSSPLRLHITGPSSTGKTGLVESLVSDTDCHIVNSDKFYLFRECKSGSLAASMANRGVRPHFFGVMSHHDRPWPAGSFVSRLRDLYESVLPTESFIVEGCSFSYNAALATAGLPLVSIGLRWQSDFDLRAYIEKRTWNLVKDGLLDETELLLATASRTAYLLTRGVYYKHLAKVLEGEILLEDAVSLIADEGVAIARDQLERYSSVSNLAWIEVNPENRSSSVMALFDFLKR